LNKKADPGFLIIPRCTLYHPGKQVAGITLHSPEREILFQFFPGEDYRKELPNVGNHPFTEEQFLPCFEQFESIPPECTGKRGDSPILDHSGICRCLEDKF